MEEHLAQKQLDLSALPQLPSLKEMSLSSIKEAILSKKLEPGIIYTEAMISSQLGISRTPVREALIHLASRGYLTFLPRKGFQLKQLTEKDVRDLFEFRCALETAIVRHITPLLTDEFLKHIDVLLVRHREAAEPDDPLASTHADREFHLYLAKLTDNPYLITGLEDIRDLIDLAGIKTHEFKVRSVEAIREHQAIVDMLKARSVSGAVQKMEEHILITQERALARIRNTATNPGSC
jgi:DNA-binding GntR family transcriptional regulator